MLVHGNTHSTQGDIEPMEIETRVRLVFIVQYDEKKMTCTDGISDLQGFRSKNRIIAGINLTAFDRAVRFYQNFRL